MGGIIPAIASTNAIVAAFEVRNMVSVLTKDILLPLRSEVNGDASRRFVVKSGVNTAPEVECLECSHRSVLIRVDLDMAATSMRELKRFLNEKCFLMRREVNLCFKGEAHLLSAQPDECLLSESENLRQNGRHLKISKTQFRSRLIVHVFLNHVPGAIGLTTRNNLSGEEIRLNYLEYLRNSSSLKARSHRDNIQQIGII